MVDIHQYLDNQQDLIVKKFVEAKEQYLLKVFGSYEVAKEVAHLYVFEEDDFNFVDKGDNIEVHYNFRVRPKTPEELAEDQQKLQDQVASAAKDVLDIHEWTWVEFNFAGWLECAGCGFRPQNQEEMNEHIPPTRVPV